MCFIKYLLFFSNAMVSVIGAGAVMAGAIIVIIFEHLLPPEISQFLRFEFLEALPLQFMILGTVVCVATLLGCCGAVLEGRVGKWLLITYAIELTLFVALNILVVSVMYAAHQKTVPGALASALTMDAIKPAHTEFIDSAANNLAVPMSSDDKSFNLRRRRQVTGLFQKAKNMVSDAASAVKDTVSTAVDTVGSGVSAVGNKVESTVESALDTAKTVRGGLKTMADVAVAGVKLAKDTGQLVISMFEELSSAEEETLKWIRPFLGQYTRPLFRLTRSNVVMQAWASAIVVEIIFIVLNIYLSTTKVYPREVKEVIDYGEFVDKSV